MAAAIGVVVVAWIVSVAARVAVAAVLRRRQGFDEGEDGEDEHGRPEGRAADRRRDRQDERRQGQN